MCALGQDELVAVTGREVQIVQHDRGRQGRAVHEREDFVPIADVEVVGWLVEKQVSRRTSELSGTFPDDAGKLLVLRRILGRGDRGQLLDHDIELCGVASEGARGLFDSILGAEPDSHFTRSRRTRTPRFKTVSDEARSSGTPIRCLVRWYASR